MFNVHIRSKPFSARLSQAQVPSLCQFLCQGQEKKRGGGSKGRTACTGGFKVIQAVRLELVAGGGCFEVLWNLECPVVLSQKRICVYFNEGNSPQFRQFTEK